MKKNYLIGTALMLTILISITKSFGQTTQEEYNYLTKGYKVQVESGLDMKKGYQLQDLNYQTITSGSTERTCTFKAFIRNGETKPCAILCIYSRDKSIIDYLCIPTYDTPKAIWDETFQKFNTYTEVGATTLIWGMAKLASYYATK